MQESSSTLTAFQPCIQTETLRYQTSDQAADARQRPACVLQANRSGEAEHNRSSQRTVVGVRAQPMAQLIHPAVVGNNTIVGIEPAQFHEIA